MLIGLVADTHRLVRSECHDALAGVELILHAGDVGSGDVLVELATIAPVEAVAGNIDGLYLNLPARLWREFDGVSVLVTHGNELGSPTPERLLDRYDADVIVFGHTHKALVHRAGPRLVVNPGAAGPRRFKLAPSVARLTILNGRAEVEIVELVT
jgi:uncharacterized protein